MPSEKRFQTAFVAMRTITLCFHKANRTYAYPPSMPQTKRCRLKKGFRRPLCVMRTITLCFHKANRTYAYYPPSMQQTKRCRLKKGFRRPLCAMRTITLCFHKANRTYVCYGCCSDGWGAFCANHIVECIKKWHNG